MLLPGALELRNDGSFKLHLINQTGLVHRILVPPAAAERFVWIACDALSAAPADWYIKARIEFWLGNNKLTEFPLSNGAILVPNQALNIYAPKTGAGMQPPLKISGIVNSLWKSMDAPCFAFRIQCDRLDFVVDLMEVGSHLEKGIVSGLAVVSQYPWPMA